MGRDFLHTAGKGGLRDEDQDVERVAVIAEG